MGEPSRRKPGRILVVDDIEANAKLLADLLERENPRVTSVHSGHEALSALARHAYDLVLLDVVMPEMDGYEVCRRIREDVRFAMLPVVMVTALESREERVKGLEAGADDFLSRPINQLELLARVRSLLRIKWMHDQTQRQASELADLNATLERRVAEKVAEVERLSRLKRFFSPKLAELIVNGGADDPLRSHRREIVVVYLDLRGFTAFSETSEPEEVMRALGAYHAAMGRIVMEHGATLERFTGDAIMLFFGDPVPVDNAAQKATRLALEMREASIALSEQWRRRGVTLGLAIGIAQGFATVGAIGFEGRIDYGAIGTVTNLACRLCEQAMAAEILLSQRVRSELDASIEIEDLGERQLHGFSHPTRIFRCVDQFK
jgi:class 3 adenylate cyclase/CheY-like chemotaxis protein